MGSKAGTRTLPALPVLWGCWCFSPQKWRPFCLRFEGVVEDFNYGTLLRLDCCQPYTEENTIFGEPRAVAPLETGSPRPRESRTHSSALLSRSSSPLATRIQFFAIEIARNREGWNSVVYSSTREPAAAEAASE